MRILKDTTFLIFSAAVFGNLFGHWLGYPLWWTAKYGVLLMGWTTSYHLVKKGNSIFLVTAIIGSMLTAAYLIFP